MLGLKKSLYSFPPHLDLRSIGLFRILLGLTLIFDLVVYKIPNIPAFYSENGILDLNLLFQISEHSTYYLYKIGFLSLLKDQGCIYLFFIFTLIVYCLFTIGYRSNLFALFSFCCLYSIHQRNSFLLSGPDEMLICCLFWSIFLPINQRFSLSQAHRTKHTADADIIITDKFRDFSTLAILFQISLIFFLSANSKNGFTWNEGTAISYVLMEDLWIKAPAAWLAQFPMLCKVLTYSAIIIEYSIALLIFFPFKNDIMRIIAAFFILSMLWAFSMFLELGIFPLIGTVLSSILIPSSLWEKMLHYVRCMMDDGRWKIPLLIVRKADSSQAGMEDDKEKNINARVPAVSIVGSSTKIPKNNFFLNVFKYIKTAIIIGAMIIIGWKIVLRVDSIKRYIPYPVFLQYLDNTTLFIQFWEMYAPNPSITHGWVKIAGYTQHNQYLDTKSQMPLKDDNSDLSYYKSLPWMIFTYKTCMSYNHFAKKSIQRWAEYEMYHWNRKHPDNKLMWVYIIKYTKTILGPQNSTPVNKKILTRYP